VARDAGTGALTGFRIIRKSLVDAISRRGINPYNPGSANSFNGNAPLTLDEGIALCGQCHVEYVCGNSSIDGIDRDYFPWAKVFELEDLYGITFPGYGSYPYTYVQDWIHGTGALSSPLAPGNGVFYKTPYPIVEPLVKSQHPEAETYWGSRHYGNGAPCFLCHMPKVTKTAGGSYTSHWLASPLKYMAPAPAATFAQTFGLKLDKDGIIVPCGACHGGLLSRMKTKAENIQDGIYSSALAVQGALVSSLKAIKAAKDAQAGGKPVDAALLRSAVDKHQAAHVRWENLVISENSMGFHNQAEVSAELNNALTYAQNAAKDATSAVGTPPAAAENTSALCRDGVDNDGDGKIDCADRDCRKYCP
jgi:nitrite reductase (cytochrome c-552)